MTAFVASGRFTSTLNLNLLDTLLVTDSGYIISYGGPAIRGAGQNQVTLNGTAISAVASGLEFATGGNVISVGAAGVAYGELRGLYVAGGGNNLLANAGVIVGNEYGVDLVGANNVVNNAGTIMGNFSAILVSGAASKITNAGWIESQNSIGIFITQGLSHQVVNTGTIIGQRGVTFGFSNQSNDFNTVINSGTIVGRGSHAIQGLGNTEVVINNGLLQGVDAAATLSSGDDFFDGRNGTQVGWVDGGPDNDVLYGGAGVDDLRGDTGNDQISGGGGADQLSGGDGFDLVRYDFATGAVTVSFANPAVNAGEAAGDIIVGFEGIVGSNFADALIGNAVANTLYGGLGDDAIAAGAGTDTLYGGAGADFLYGEGDADFIVGGPGGDVIRGGSGGDLYVFNLGDNGDLIRAFNEGGARDGFDLRGYFDAIGFAGADPRAAGLMQLLQNGADTDVYLSGAFAFRIEGVVAAAVDNTYFLFQ